MVKKKQKSKRKGYWFHEFEPINEIIKGIEDDFKSISDYMKRDCELIKDLPEIHASLFNRYWTSCLYVINELLSRSEFDETKDNRIYNQMYLWEQVSIDKPSMPQKTNNELVDLNSNLLNYIEGNIGDYTRKNEEIIDNEVMFHAQTSCNTTCICNHIRHRVNELCYRCKISNDNQMVMSF